MTARAIRALVVTSVLGVFLGGLVVGYVLGTRRAAQVASPAPSQPPGPRPPPPPEVRIDRMLDVFARRLELTADQRAQIRRILLEGERDARAILERARPELEARRASLEAAIVDLLDEPQRVRYREMLPDGLPRPPGGPPGGPPPGGPPGPGRRGPPP